MTTTVVPLNEGKYTVVYLSSKGVNETYCLLFRSPLSVRPSLSLVEKGVVLFVKSSVSQDFRGTFLMRDLATLRISIINRHQHYFAQHSSMYHVVTYGSES